jgi:hypothetical protein
MVINMNNILENGLLGARVSFVRQDSIPVTGVVKCLWLDKGVLVGIIMLDSGFLMEQKMNGCSIVRG